MLSTLIKKTLNYINHVIATSACSKCCKTQTIHRSRDECNLWAVFSI